jgi:hypothetical protein
VPPSMENIPTSGGLNYVLLSKIFIIATKSDIK